MWASDYNEGYEMVEFSKQIIKNTEIADTVNCISLCQVCIHSYTTNFELSDAFRRCLTIIKSFFNFFFQFLNRMTTDKQTDKTNRLTLAAWGKYITNNYNN